MCSKSQGFYGEPAKIRESEIEAYLVKRVKELGGDTRKLKWIGRRGAPDRFVMLYGGFFVELKAPGKKLRPEQEREHSLLRSNGIGVYVLDTTVGVDKLLNRRIYLGKKLSPKSVTPP